MKINFTRSEIVKYLSVCRNALSNKTTIPALSGVLITVNTEILATVSDMELFITATIPGKIESTGSVCVPLVKLMECLKSMSGSDVSMEVKGTRLTIVSGVSTFKLSTLADNPPMPDIVQLEYSLIDKLVLNLADKVSFASPRRSLDESRFAICGSMVRKYNGKAYVFANNDHRACFFTVPEDVFPGKSILFTSKLVDAVNLAMDIDTGDLRYCENNNIMGFLVGKSFNIFSLKSAKNPPQIEAILSKYADESMGGGKIFEVGRTALLDAVKASSTFGDDIRRLSVCSLSGKDGKLIVSSLGTSTGEAETVFDCPEVDGVCIAMDSKYLLEFLPHINGDKIKMAFKDSKSPMVMRGDMDGLPAVLTISPVHI